MKSRTEEVRMSRNLYRIVRRKDGRFEYRPVLEWAHTSHYGPEKTDDSPLDLSQRGLPEDMEKAITTIRGAKQRDADSPRVQNALAVLRRYVNAFEKQQSSRQAGRKQADEQRMSPEEVLESFELATQFYEEDPSQSRTAILNRVAKRINTGRKRDDAMSWKRLEREGVRPLMPGEKSHT